MTLSQEAQRTKFLKAPETGFAFFDGKIGNIASLASWRFRVFLGSGCTLYEIGVICR